MASFSFDASAQTFYLSDLDITADASLALMAGTQAAAFGGDAIAELDVPLAVLRALFQYHTDASDVDDVVSTDTLYKVVHSTTSVPISSNFIINTIVTANNQDSNDVAQDLARDYVRYLAYKLFNTVQGVDLFDNEEELRTNLNARSRESLNARLLELADKGDLDADTTVDNPSMKLLKQIIKNDPDRFSRIANGQSAYPWTIASGNEADENAWYEMPLIAGDVICFLLHVNADSNQKSIVNDAVANPAQWTYLIKMHAV